MEEKKNLCAPIPLSLHQRLRAEQEQRGQTLADYITDILREHFVGGARTMNANNRTIAFQVPEELFDRLKDYLARNGLKQKDFILGLIERELNDAGNEESNDDPQSEDPYLTEIEKDAEMTKKFGANGVFNG